MARHFVEVDEGGVIHLVDEMAWHIDRGNCGTELGDGWSRMTLRCKSCWGRLTPGDEIEMRLTPHEASLILGRRMERQG